MPRNRINQVYEEYWSYTAAWTDINGNKFVGCLKACIDFMDQHNVQHYDSSLYAALQQEVSKATGIGDVSVRKGINQMVKLGFLKPYLLGYRPEAKEYIDAKTDKRRENILSKVVYNHSNFQNSITDPDAGTANQIKFLLNTLEEVGQLNKRSLIALMTTDINDYSRGYLTVEELDMLSMLADDNDFIDRKYNQLSHFINLLGRLNDLCVHDGVIYFKTDAEKLFGGNVAEKKPVRDPYLQRIYKSELEEESCIHYECNIPKCMLEGLSYPVLIASHIKPYKDCLNDKKAQFDVNNGLLLSKNFDSLFDLGYITISNEGIIIPSKILDTNVKEFLTHFRLHQDFINSKRMDYMEYHREKVFEQKYSSISAKRYVFIDDYDIGIAAEP